MPVENIAERPLEPSAAASAPDAVRARLRGMWASVAGAWSEHAGYVDARGVEATARMLELADPRPGERVLELACGPGTVGLAAAGRVGAEGEVVMSDVVSEMTSIAAERAARLGLANVRARDLDLEAIAEPDASFDVVLCREGLMLVPDPARGAREMRRVLRPGGRLALAVWGPRAENPWLGILFDAVTALTGEPVPPPGLPGPFSLDDADALSSVLTDAGLAEVTVERWATPQRVGSFAEWLRMTSALAGPLAKRLEALPEPAARELRDRLRVATAPYETGDGLELPGVSLVASARRAEA
jgi:SAM-dependent methyltransferase